MNIRTEITKEPYVLPTLVCQGPLFYLKVKVKKGHNSKTTAFRVMPLVLQQHLVMITKYSKFNVTLNTFCVMGYIKVFAQRDVNLAITIARLFLQNRRDKTRNVVRHICPP